MTFVEATPRSWSATNWSDPAMGQSLRLAAESICVFGGFLATAVSVVRDGQLVIVAIAGAERVKGATGEVLSVDAILGRTLPVSTLEERLLPNADDWGLLQYIPHDREVHQVGWRVDWDYEGTEWHPDDMLVVPVRDDAGRLRGLMALDGPVDGRIPPPERRPLLERYAGQAARVLLTALEREEFAERLRLAETARQVLSRAASGTSPTAGLESIADDLVAAFDLVGLRAMVFHGNERQVLAEGGAAVGEENPRLARIRRHSAERLWSEQEVGILTRQEFHRFPVDAEDEAYLRDYLRRNDLESILLAPLGSGEDVLGCLTLYRGQGSGAWTDPEQLVAREIGRDLGRVLSIRRALMLEQQATEELRAIDDYKSKLIATVAHELKNPIAAIRANLDDALAGCESPTVLASLAGIDRGTHRVGALVDELLVLSAAADPNAFPVEELELTALVRDAVEHAREALRAGPDRIRLDLPADPVIVTGNARGLQIMVVNLVGNALKYSADETPVEVRLRCPADGLDGVELSVIDRGFGISEADQEHLFTEFFRSTNPAALAQPGTGLGLAIVDRIVRRHHGHVHVLSTLGSGSTFRVFLPSFQD